MNEAGWLAAKEPIALLEFLRGSPVSEDSVTWPNSRWQTGEPCPGPDRRFRLFACACCRRVWDLIPEACNRDAVAAVEGFVDGRVGGPELEAALVASSAVEWAADGAGRRAEPGYWAVKYLGRGFYKMTAAASALVVAVQAASAVHPEYGGEAGMFLVPFRRPAPAPAAVDAELAAQAALVRCIFGNPFRPVAPDPRWRTADVLGLARGIYEDRAFDRLPLLADALLDAGCESDEVLGHCRGGGPHARGCWVVDLALGNG